MKPFVCRALFVCAGVAACAVTGLSQSSQVDLHSAIVSGGGTNTSGAVTVKSTIGQPVAGSDSNGGYTVGVGLLPIATSSGAQTPLSLVKATSRRTHGSAGTFDLDITNGNAIECRIGATNNSYLMVFAFSNPITNCGAASTGTVNQTAPSECGVTVSVPTGQHITVQLTGVTDVNGATTTASATMGVLVGDTNSDTFVDAIDTSQTKSQAGHAVSTSNFREDVNVDGFIDAIDTSLVKSKSGTVLSSSSSKPPSSPPKAKPRRRLAAPSRSGE